MSKKLQNNNNFLHYDFSPLGPLLSFLGEGGWRENSCEKYAVVILGDLVLLTVITTMLVEDFS